MQDGGSRVVDSLEAKAMSKPMFEGRTEASLLHNLARCSIDGARSLHRE